MWLIPIVMVKHVIDNKLEYHLPSFKQKSPAVFCPRCFTTQGEKFEIAFYTNQSIQAKKKRAAWRRSECRMGIDGVCHGARLPHQSH